MGELVVAAVPIGDISDASDHLKSAIEAAQIVVAEDSRKFFRLCKDLDIEVRARVISFFEGNEIERVEDLRKALIESESVLLITDSGMPTISDPGYRAIRIALDEGLSIRVIPGPSAVITALVLSGLPTDRFCFEGFAPRTDVARENFFSDLSEEQRTMVFFEAPHRIEDFLATATRVFGESRQAAVCREMTKRYEEVVRGNLHELWQWSKSKEMLGEFTVVIAGFNPSDSEHSDEEIADRVKRCEAAGISRKEAINIVAKELKIPKRKVFDVMVEYK